MAIHHVEDDLLETPYELVAHGVNCAGAIGSGVAGQIVNKWPVVRDAYMVKYERDRWELGDLQVVPVLTMKSLGPRAVVNCATQRTYLPRGRRHFDYDAWGHVCHNLNNLVMRLGPDRWRVAMPRIGSGLAGGDWPQALAILEACFWASPVEVFVYTLPGHGVSVPVPGPSKRSEKSLVSA